MSILEQHTPQYLHEGTVVVPTGLTADKQITRRNGTTTLTVHEITPASQTDGSWKKWVNLTDLYKVKIENTDDEDSTP